MRLFAAFVIALLSSPAPAARGAAGQAVPADRWLEIDLYWFDAQQIDRSVEAFWARYAPLYRGVEGHKGIVLNLGMTVNYVMTFSGDLDQEIVLPKGEGQELGHEVRGRLEGDTAQRQQAWRERFRAPPVAAQSIGYGRWRYSDLKRLTAAMRARAARAGIREFRVASLVVGQDGAYGELAPFARHHPEAWTRWREEASGALASSSHFDPAATLRADPMPLAGLPDGIREGLPVHAAFAAQWGALSKAVGLGGIMLRDSMSFPRAYTRYGQFGALIPNAAAADRITEGLAALISGSKRANPDALIMMYSTAATATSDWRANGVDLERIAREGYLDIFVDQTWAGAWGEVGVRRQTFWNAPILGWTYQLAYLLQHAAMLADTRVRHYPLIETFDAWESWDTIHTAPERLRWAIWAYSHAGVKTPRGLRMPAGSYISWGNHGRDLLSEADVAFLSGELNHAARDAAATREIFGPTMVYSREAMAAQVANIAPGFDVRDRTDEQVGSIVKWPLPLLSITRLEWLPEVRSDLFLFGATRGIGQASAEMVAARARAGQPMAFFGAFDGAIEPAFLRLAGVTVAPHDPPQQDRILRAGRGAAMLGPIANFPDAFDAPPTRTRGTAAPGTTVYGFGDSAALVLKEAGPLNVALWDPAPLMDYWYRPLRDLMNGSPAPYALTAATLTRQLAAGDALRANIIDLDQTGTVAAWRTSDGLVHVLAGNLEEGLRDDADQSRHVSLALPAGWRSPQWRSSWSGGSWRSAGDVLHMDLPPQGSMLLQTRAPVAPRPPARAN